jgi:hypothetical protein
MGELNGGYQTVRAAVDLLSLQPLDHRRTALNDDGVDRSELFAEMVRAHCRRSIVSHHQAMAGEPAEPDAGQSRGARL